MKKHTWMVLPLVVGVIACGLVIGDMDTGPYAGSSACEVCHKLMHKEIVEGYGKTAHAKAYRRPDEEGGIVADFTSNSIFGKDKVAHVLGKGLREQAFLDADMKVLPAKWDVRSKAWKPKSAVDGATQCIGCHVTGYNAEKRSFAQGSVTCESCHGPGAEHVKGNAERIVNPKKLDKARQSMVCGQCHSAGKDTSGKYAFPISFKPGDDLAKHFVDAKPTGPGSSQQYSEFITSKHASEGLVCMSCHDPHGTSGNEHMLRKPINVLCLDCHAGTVKDMATHAPGAPEGETCAGCHMPGGQHTFAKLSK